MYTHNRDYYSLFSPAILGKKGLNNLIHIHAKNYHRNASFDAHMSLFSVLNG
jgi:hypothetical protein